MQSIKLNEKIVKHLGRTLTQDDILWLSLSGSGIEFLYTGTYLEICLQGDDHIDASTDHTRIAVYIDDKRVLDEMVKSSQPRYTIIDEQTPVTCAVRILKLSEAPMSIVGIRELIADDNAKISCLTAVTAYTPVLRMKLRISATLQNSCPRTIL